LKNNALSGVEKTGSGKIFKNVQILPCIVDFWGKNLIGKKHTTKNKQTNKNHKPTHIREKC
jgi:hypothetical protein